MGYTIPAGAAIINNVRAIHMDPKRHPNPRAFDPARYADDKQSEFEAATNPDPSKRDQYVFGAGRRLCQGMHIAERSLFLGIARTLWAFELSKAVDAVSGSVVTPDIANLTQSLFVQPAPFSAVIKPRSEKHEKIVRREWKLCEDTLLDKETKQWKEVPKGMVFSTYTPAKEVDF